MRSFVKAFRLLLLILLVGGAIWVADRPAVWQDLRGFLELLEGGTAHCRGQAPGSLAGIVERFSGLPQACFEGQRMACEHEGYRYEGRLRCDAESCHLALRRDRYTPGDPELFSVELEVDRHGDGIDADVLCY